jgi:RNA polymerase sigma factor (sigma-70 family)
VQRSRWPSVVRQLLSQVPDGELLDRYVLQHDDDAFAQLVARYSRLVWGQCRNLLPDDADADDAFQATFLTLARSAKSIRAGSPLGPWLHGVAYRVCQNARRVNGRRARREKASAQFEADRPVADSTWEEAFTAVSEEVQKLPESQRTAFVLCCLEGRATTEAAALLGLKLGTFSARLTRAKQALLDRLAKRGFGAGLLALGGVTGSVAVAPASLIERTLLLVPSGATIPSSIQTLMQGVTSIMMIRFKLLAVGVFVAIGLSLGSGWYSSATAQPGPEEPPANKIEPPKNGSKVEKLKAELEKLKAELAAAEEEERRLLERQIRARALELEYRRMLVNTAKYEYEPLPKGGLTTREFEAKLDEREKAGWSFLGQVSLNSGNQEMVPTLVFRKPGPRTVIKGGSGSGGTPFGKDPKKPEPAPEKK